MLPLANNLYRQPGRLGMPKYVHQKFPFSGGGAKPGPPSNATWFLWLCKCTSQTACRSVYPFSLGSRQIVASIKRLVTLLNLQALYKQVYLSIYLFAVGREMSPSKNASSRGGSGPT